MEISEVQKLIHALEASSLAELEIEEDGKRIRLSKGAAPAVTMYAPHPGMPLALGQPVPQTPPQTPAPQPAESPPAAPVYAATIDSPMVGTFYSSPAPGDPPFVVPGDTVEIDQTVCIIEAMKIMNEVTAKISCVVERILVENGEPVEFGQALFAVRPLD